MHFENYFLHVNNELHLDLITSIDRTNHQNWMEEKSQITLKIEFKQINDLNLNIYIMIFL